MPIRVYAHTFCSMAVFLVPNYVICVSVGDRSDQEKQEMEKEIWELRAKLNHSAVMSEIEELKRCIERKDKERTQLGMQIEVTIFENDFVALS